jgi:hypothetical protein
MSDYSEQGAIPAEDAAVEDPPTVDEVMEAQREDLPEQAATSTMCRPSGGDEEPLTDEAAQEHERGGLGER